MISYIIASLIIIFGIILLAISKTKMTILIPMVGAILLIGVVATVYQKWEGWKNSITTAATDSNKSEKFVTATPKAPKWKLVEEKVVDFSKLRMERFDQQLNFPIIPVSLNKLELGNYRIKLSGSWEFFMSSGRWIQFPWQGKTYPQSLPEYRPDKGKEFCAIILLNNGEDITPVNNEGFNLNSTGSVNLSLRINLLMRTDEFYSERIIDRASKLTLSNSEREPLKIIIEKEVI